jgi:hypothetical protein
LKFYGDAWLDPVKTGRALAAWAEGEEAVPAPGCPEIARTVREALVAGRSSDEAVMDGLAALGVVRDGKLRGADELAATIEKNLGRGAPRPRPGETGTATAALRR